MKFRKFIVITIFFLLAIFNATCAVAGNEANMPEIKAYVKVTSTLRVRNGPSTSESVISRLESGEIVTIEETLENGWSKVCLENGVEGYVSSNYIVIPQIKIEGYDIEIISSAVITSKKSSENRNFNMAKACESINGLILNPGDEFNWYGSDTTDAVVGRANKANGYKEATVIENGQYVKGYGGGVCQVSTAVYNSIYKLDIVPTELHHHSLTSTYVEKDMDATVSYPSKNFVFYNTKDYPIIFEAYTDGGQVVVVAYKMISITD